MSRDFPASFGPFNDYEIVVFSIVEGALPAMLTSCSFTPQQMPTSNRIPILARHCFRWLHILDIPSGRRIVLFVVLGYRSNGMAA
jgi:hypothetical protein